VTLLALASACHTRSAADPSQEEKAAQQAEGGDDSSDEDGKDGDGKDDDGKDDGKAGASKDDDTAAHQASPASAGEKESSGKSAAGTAKSDGKDGKDGEIDPDDIEVSTSAQGLLKPGAEDRIREKLGVDKGKGMRSALQKFQREHQLPATGMIDHETVIKLGFEPSDIWERAN
jgi:hypothetical protein